MNAGRGAEPKTKHLQHPKQGDCDKLSAGAPSWMKLRTPMFLLSLWEIDR